MISVVLVGASGRMGKAIEAAAAAAEDVQIKARVGRTPAPGLVSAGSVHGVPVYTGHAARARTSAGTAAVSGGGLSDVVAPGDVVIEFSSPEGCRDAARACSERGAGLVSGTTGLGLDDESALSAAAQRVPVLRASNFSLGVLALRRALGAALEALPSSWDIEIVERHHRRKLDSPSGTALQIAREAADRRGLSASALRFGREGLTGPRSRDEIGVHAVRGGSWVGDHAVLIAGEGEWLEFRHVAQDRSAFAEGALAAARFVARATPGLYTLDNILIPSPGRAG